MAIERTCYGQDRVEAAPLDARLHLPQRQSPCLLQRWLGSFVVNDAHAEAIRHLASHPGEPASRRGREANKKSMAAVEAVYTIKPRLCARPTI